MDSNKLDEVGSEIMQHFAVKSGMELREAVCATLAGLGGQSVERNAVLEEAAQLVEDQRGLSEIDMTILRGAAMAVRQLKSAAPAKPELAVGRTNPIIKRGFFLADGAPGSWTMGAYHADQPAGMELAENGVVIVAGRYSAELTAERRAAMGLAAPVAQPLAPSGAVPTWQERSNMREFIQPKDAVPHMVAEIRDLRDALAAQPLAGQDVRAADRECGAAVGWNDALAEVRATVAEMQNNLEAFGEYSQETARCVLDGVLNEIDDMVAAAQESDDE